MRRPRLAAGHIAGMSLLARTTTPPAGAGRRQADQARPLPDARRLGPAPDPDGRRPPFAPTPAPDMIHR